jgi:hypothetical protein
MKATLTGNEREGQRILLEAESVEETVALAYQPNLDLVEETRGHRILLELRYKIVPTHRSETFFSRELGEDWDEDRRVERLHAEYGQLKLKYLALEAERERNVSRTVELAKMVTEGEDALTIRTAQLAQLMRACNSRKVGEQWPAIGGVINSFGKVEHT